MLKNYLDDKNFKIDMLIKDEMAVQKYKIWETNKGRV